MKTFFCLAVLLSVNLRAADAPAPSPADFRVTAAFPKYVTADIEFRDPTGAKWPNFFYGKPANNAGIISLDTAKPAANFALLCDKMAQDRGDQSRRVLGDLCPPEKPPVLTLTITAVGPLQPAAAGGKNKNAVRSDLTGTLEIAGRKLPVKVATTLLNHDGKGDEKNRALMLDGHCTLKATDLGLKALPPAALVEMRFGLTAYPPEAAAPSKK